MNERPLLLRVCHACRAEMGIQHRKGTLKTFDGFVWPQTEPEKATKAEEHRCDEARYVHRNGDWCLAKACRVGRRSLRWDCLECHRENILRLPARDADAIWGHALQTQCNFCRVVNTVET